MSSSYKKHLPKIVSVISIVLFVFLTQKYINKNLGGEKREYVDFILDMAGFLTSIFGMLYPFSPLLQRQKKIVFEKLGLPDTYHGWRTADAHLRNAQIDLLKATINDCKKMLAGIESSSALIKDGKGIELNFTTYTDVTFPNLINAMEGRTSRKMEIPLNEGTVRCSLLGDAGNGKTFGLLNWIKPVLEHQLDVLLDKKEKTNKLDEAIPVYLSLGNYVFSHNGDLKNWLIAEISKKYKLYKKAGMMVLENHIIPCLDGLDEVAKENRLVCLNEILDYSKDNSVIFTCRKKELHELVSGVYENDTPVMIIEMNPVDMKDIEQTLLKEKERIILKQLETTISSDVIEKREFNNLRTPLILDLIVQSADDITDEELGDYGKIEKRNIYNLLWGKYDKKNFKRKQIEGEEEKIIRTRAVHLAKRIKGNTFFIDNMQPAWLDSGVQRLNYYLTSRIISGFFLAIGIGLFIATPMDFISEAMLCSIVFALLTIYLNKKGHGQSMLMMVLLYTLIAIVIGALVQGFTVPRQDMVGAFSPSESYSGVVFGLFFGVVLGFRKQKQSFESDNNPVEVYAFDWKKSLLYGLSGGILIGLFLGIAAIIVELNFNKSIFYEDWLSSAMVKWSRVVPDSLINISEGIHRRIILIFSFACCVGFFVGFLIVALLAGRNSSKNSLNDDDKKKTVYKLNYGFTRSMWHSVVYGIIAFTIVALLYSWIIYSITHSEESLVKSLQIAAGTGIISVLWFGGFDAIQHWTLRYYLHYYGIAPLNYEPWVKKAEDLAFVSRAGASLRFRHETMIGYFSSLANQGRSDLLTEIKRPPAMKYVLVGFVLCVLISVISPFYSRALRHEFWPHYNKMVITPKKSPDFRQVRDTSYLILLKTRKGLDSIIFDHIKRIVISKQGYLHVAAEGKVKAGTFTGYVKPEGTQVALFGAFLDSVYNLDSKVSHCAVMYKPKQGRQWFPFVTAAVSPWSDEIRTGCIKVGKGDTLELAVNDKEFQNNTGIYKIAMGISDTCTCLKGIRRTNH